MGHVFDVYALNTSTRVHACVSCPARFVENDGAQHIFERYDDRPAVRAAVLAAHPELVELEPMARAARHD